MNRNLLTLAVLGWLGAAAATSLDQVARSKIDSIVNGRIRPGSTVTFTSAELNAYAQTEVPRVVPQGVRQPRLELGNGMATGYALVDFLKVRHGQGEETPWLIARLIEGEKPVMAVARIESANGRATVHLQRVEISGIAVSGTTLDFLIRNFFMPLYPNAKIDQPFELADRIDRIEVAPTVARVVMRP